MTKEQKKEYHAAYYTKHRARLLEKFREWKSKNRSKHRASSSRWQKENKAASKAIKRRWKKNHPEKAKQANKRKTARSLAAHAARQRVRFTKTQKPTPEVTAIYIRSASLEIIPCHWCHCETVRGARHVDHITALSKGGTHTPDNLAIACVQCNLTKHALDPAAFASKRKGGY